MKKTVKEAMENGASYEEVEKTLTEENFEKHLETSFMPDPELLIRTGWRVAYQQLPACGRLPIQSCISAIPIWPDFNEECLHKAIESYQSRQRRFGKTEAQVEAEEEK